MRSGKRHYRITLADVLDAHDSALQEGGADGINNFDSLQSAIGRPYTGYYHPIYKKAAALVESLCNNHGFIDGNKRTAVYMLNVLLERSGYELVPFGNEEMNTSLENMIVSVATREMNYHALEEWLKKRIIKG